MSIELPNWGSAIPVNCEPKEWLRDKNGNLSPVHQHKDGSWWWCDEGWVDEFGPFDTKEEAEQSCLKYCKEVLGN
jgi:hypothetical protein